MAIDSEDHWELENDSDFESESGEDDDPLEYDSSAESDGESNPSVEYEGEAIERVVPRLAIRDKKSHEIFQPISTQTAESLGGPASKRRALPDYDGLEHIAGPGCQSTRGYTSFNISYEEMEHCTMVQGLMRKPGNWRPEDDDLDFERTTNYCLTGIAPTMPSTDEDSPKAIVPRHGFERFEVNRYAFGFDAVALPFHPTCFEIFQRISKLHFGYIDVHGLKEWWKLQASNSYSSPLRSERHPAVRRGLDQEWQHFQDDAFLVSNPVLVRGLDPLLKSAIHGETSFNPQHGAFPTASHSLDTTRNLDPFLVVPEDITDNVLVYLNSRDIANLRLSSRAFRQIRISLWYRLLREEMPWLWEIYSTDKPSFWASLSLPDYMAEQYLKPILEAELESYRHVIKDEMPEKYDDWCAAEPTFNQWAVTCREIYEASSPLRLPRDHTNWYELYSSITRHWKELKGLQNRQRIWNDVEKIMAGIKQYRDEGKII